MLMFYFASDDNRLRFDDGREIKLWTTHKVDCEPILCEQGLHASRRLIDALAYAPGPHLYLVKLSGTVIHSNDKSCATERRYIAYFNAEETLFEFARKQALINIKKIKPYCSVDKYNTIIDWLVSGETRLKSAAEFAAWSAAKSAAKSAAWSAAGSAAWSAAKSAAWSAAEFAAWSAAKSAAWAAAESAARSAAESAANQMLTDMVREKTGWDI